MRLAHRLRLTRCWTGAAEAGSHMVYRSVTRRPGQHQRSVKYGCLDMIENFKITYPTRGDLAREQLRRRGFPLFADVQNQIRARLDLLPELARKAFAFSCAERLMRRHESLPEAAQRTFTLGWRPVLDVVWEGLTSESEQTIKDVNTALAAFYASPYYHDEGPDGPDDADENAAAASIYACECFVTGKAEPAYWASARAIDAAFAIAANELALDENDFIWDPNAEPMPLAKEAMHAEVQTELALQLSDLSRLEAPLGDNGVIFHLRG